MSVVNATKLTLTIYPFPFFLHEVNDMRDYWTAEVLMIMFSCSIKDAGHSRARGQLDPRRTVLQSSLGAWLAVPGLLSVNVLNLLSLALNLYK